MAGCSIIQHKGKDIIYTDHRGLKEAAVVENMKKAFELIDNYRGAEILCLTDFRDTFGTAAVTDFLKRPDIVKINSKVKRTALLGITGVKKLLLNSYNKITGIQMNAIDDETAAKDWLVS